METINSFDHSITTHELLVRSAEAALDIQRDDGSFPAPQYGADEESPTPVRTTAQWLLTLTKAYNITAEERFYDASADAASYLLKDDVRPSGFTFHARDAPGKDSCDGLVGQAAPIRALARTSTVLERPELADIAREIVHLHPFNERLGLWECVDIDGTTLSFDRTLNHQLIFAASIATLADDDSEIARLLRRFLTMLPSTMRLHDDGLIKHYIRPNPTDALRTVVRSPSHWRLLLNEVVFHYYSRSAERRRTEIGYHPVNLSSLATLRRAVPNHTIWNREVIQQALEFSQANSKLYLSGTESHGGSAMPGTNIALALRVLGDKDLDDVLEFLESDIRRKYDEDSGLLTTTDSDSTFQAAAVFLLSHFPNITIQL
jgi:hypothetical protein